MIDKIELEIENMRLQQEMQITIGMVVNNGLHSMIILPITKDSSVCLVTIMELHYRLILHLVEK